MKRIRKINNILYKYLDTFFNYIICFYQFFIVIYINNFKYFKNKSLKLTVYLILSLVINIYKYSLIMIFLKYLKIRFYNINNLNFNLLKINKFLFFSKPIIRIIRNKQNKYQI